jgi:hypothetical protein
MTGVTRDVVEGLDKASSRFERPAGGRMEAVEIVGAENPFEEAAAIRGVGAGAGVSGAFSCETFASAGSLQYTHEDASGFLSYLAKFNPNNFWYRDGNVQPWAYHEQYDDWQDTYGMDAVCAVYHSGHGGMANDGNFLAPLGAGWGGMAPQAWSFNMRLGNERARYVFWSTCLSCRVTGGHNPNRSWAPANLGFRMLFGYETVSWDNPNYGSAFWKHWNQNKSFSTAWMDASWYDVAHDQAPSVAAWGASAAEAQNRVFNERFFNTAQVARNYYWWRVYWAASSAMARRSPNLTIPSSIQAAQLEQPSISPAYVENILSRHDVPVSGALRAVQLGSGTGFRAGGDDVSVAVEPDGSYEIKFADPNRDNDDQIPARQAIGAARDFARRQGLDAQDLTFDRMLVKVDGGGSDEGDGERIEPRVTETVVQFTQVIDGIPVLGPGPGQLSVSLDNDGTVTGIRNASRGIAELVDRSIVHPPTPDGGNQSRGEEPDFDRILADGWGDVLRTWLVRGRQVPVAFADVPGSAEVGYVVRDSEAVLVARKDVEVDFGNGLFKRYRVERPIAEG